MENILKTIIVSFFLLLVGGCSDFIGTFTHLLAQMVRQRPDESGQRLT